MFDLIQILQQLPATCPSTKKEPDKVGTRKKAWQHPRQHRSFRRQRRFIAAGHKAINVKFETIKSCPQWFDKSMS